MVRLATTNVLWRTVDQSNIHYGHCWLCFAVITVACFKCWLCPFVAAHSTSYSPYGCRTSSTCCLIKLPWFSFTCHSLCMIIIGSRLVMKHLSTQRPLSVFYFCLRIAETVSIYHRCSLQFSVKRFSVGESCCFFSTVERRKHRRVVHLSFTRYARERQEKGKGLLILKRVLNAIGKKKRCLILNL